MTTTTALVRNIDEADRRWFYGGGVLTWLARAEETGGAFLLFEDVMGQGKRTPLHSHPEADETMVVLEGEILMHLDGTDHRVVAGGIAVAPRGVPHAFLVVSEAARLLCLHVPGCCQAFYDAASGPVDEAGTVDFDKVVAAGASTGGMVMLGPPPFAQS
jgi:quercetin dioxygenase-like cupin family protein